MRVGGCAAAALLLAATARADEVTPESAKVTPAVAVASVTATSFLANPKEPQRYAPVHALLSRDTRYDNADSGAPVAEEAPPVYSAMWCEGRSDEGVGETWILTFAGPSRVDVITIAAGVWKSDRLFARNNLPTRLEVAVDGGAPKVVAMPAGRKQVGVEIGSQPVTRIDIKLAGVAKRGINDSCLSSVKLWRGDEAVTPLFGVPVEAAAKLPAVARALAKALLAEDVEAVARMSEFPLSIVTPSDVLGGHQEPVVHASAAALIRACKAWRKAGRPDDRTSPCPRWPRLHSEGIAVSGDQDGSVELTSSTSEYPGPWKLIWRNGAWKLASMSAN
jgi:hypothetical protein